MPRPPIHLFTDFGTGGPWLGQMQAVIASIAPGVQVINLLADAPLSRPRPAAYLLEACVRDIPADAVFCCVVDPGVGSGRGVLVVETESGRFVGPDNGLLSRVAGAGASVREVRWRPAALSGSFHGRDLFAPVAAMLANGSSVETSHLDRGDMVGAEWPASLAEVIYIDHFGNAMTGLHAGDLLADEAIGIGDREVFQARTFYEVPTGQAFWYVNSLGLIEIAVNLGRADRQLDLAVGSPITIV